MSELTPESEALLERIDSLNGRSFPLATRDDFRAIEAAARRDAVREALVRTEAVPEDAPGIGSGKAAVWYERGWLDRADAIFAALAATESNHQSITATEAEMARAAMARPEYES